MAQIALKGDTHGASLDALADDRLHGRNLVIGSVPLLGRLTHHVATDSRMADERGDVMAEPLIQGIEILRDRLPGPCDPGTDGFQRDRLHVGQNSGQHLAIFPMGRSHRQRTVADDDSGNTVIARVGTERIPGDLGIVMSVVVDDSGSDHQAIRIQHLARLSTHLSDLDDMTVANGDVAVKARQSGTVNNLSVSDDQVVWHCSSCAAGERRIAATQPNYSSSVAGKFRRFGPYSMTRFMSILLRSSLVSRHTTTKGRVVESAGTRT
jgi:hypothetical protein